MKKIFSFVLIVLLFGLIASCGNPKEIQELATSISITQTSVYSEIDKTKTALYSEIDITKTALSNQQSTMEAENSNISKTAEALNGVMQTQSALDQKAKQYAATLAAAEQARANPEVVGQDPLLDSILQAIDPSIGNSSFEYKGFDYTQKQIKGVKSVKRMLYSKSETGGEFFVQIQASKKTSLFPSKFAQVISGLDHGKWQKIIINNSSYFNYPTNLYTEVATSLIVGDGCILLVYVYTYGEVNNCIDYLVEARRVITSQNLPYCGSDNI